MKDLNNNKTDRFVAILKGGLGIIPWVGSAFAEACTYLIPEQRLDRLAKYFQVLNDKVHLLGEEILKSRLLDPARLELLNEGAINASKSISNERLLYFSNMVVQGITEEKVDFSREIHLMRILSELTDVEVITLRYHLFKGIDEYDNEFKTKYKSVYNYPAISASDASGKRELLENQLALQISYRVHLAALGLLFQTNQAGINKSTLGAPRPTQAKYAITFLGKMLLERIGLVTDEDKSTPYYPHIAPQFI